MSHKEGSDNWRRGVLESTAGNHDRAIELLQKVCADPSAGVEVVCDLAAALGRAGRHEEAATASRAATNRFPNESRAWHNLGVALELGGDPTSAVDAYRRAIELRPRNPAVHICLGHALRKLLRYEDAVRSYQHAITLDEKSGAALHGLAEAFGKQNRLSDLLATYRQLSVMPCATAAAHSNLIFNMYYDARTTPATLLAESKAWADRYGSYGLEPPRFSEIGRATCRRLRVGYLSADFRDHPVGRLLEPILSGHDRSWVESICYNDIRVTADSLTARLKVVADQWREVSPLTDSQLTDLIRNDRVDILVDPTGHFAEHRLGVFARRAARVQANAFGWCGTTGISEIDYRLTDEASDPTGKTDSFHTEKLIRMPHGAWVYRPWDKSPDVGGLPADRQGFVTFGNMNNGIKTTPAMAALWCDILRRVPGSKLMILCRREAQSYLTAPFARHGLPPDRLILVPNQPRWEYMKTFNDIDIVLDPFPFNGDNSSCDALWMGVPLVTLYGTSYHTRRGLSHLSQVGLTDLATKTPSNYADVAVALANDVPRLRKLREELRDRVATSPLGNVKLFVRDLEDTYRKMFLNRSGFIRERAVSTPPNAYPFQS